MQFVVDEMSWSLEGTLAADYIESIESILDLIDQAKEQDWPVYFSEELFHTEICYGKYLYDLYAEDSEIPISRDIQERFAAIFGSLQKWQDLDREWPETFEAAINNTAKKESTSIAWAHKQSSLGDITACLVLKSHSATGCTVVEVSNNAIDLWLISSGSEYKSFFRWIIKTHTTHPNEIEELSDSAFPCLEFRDGVFGDIKEMSKPYIELRAVITHHLSILSDFGPSIFSEPWERAPSEFGKYGVNISDENGKTKQKPNCRKQRTRKVGGKDYIFYWHSKLERDRDRIHLYPNKERNNGKILIGIFCKHFDT